MNLKKISAYATTIALLLNTFSWGTHAISQKPTGAAPAPTENVNAYNSERNRRESMERLPNVLTQFLQLYKKISPNDIQIPPDVAGQMTPEDVIEYLERFSDVITSDRENRFIPLLLWEGFIYNLHNDFTPEQIDYARQVIDKRILNETTPEQRIFLLHVLLYNDHLPGDPYSRHPFFNMALKYFTHLVAISGEN